ncbi:MAG: TrkH family potassium uptake protein [Bacteroidia bacterium]|nr:TrkH family potassium uptake protein [Bacteroidia bacterium]
MKKINFNIILKLLSFIFFIEACAFSLCLPVALIYNEPLIPFLLSILVAIIPFVFLRLLSRANTKDEIQNHEALFSVVFGWFVMILLGILPYIFSGSIPHFINAVFESTSGFTTTGSSILTDVEALPKSVLFWRSLTHWVGGIGIISLVIIILPSLDVGGYRIFSLESSLQEKIRPRIKTIGRSLLAIYLLLTFSQVILMMLGGMNLYESLCHAFGTVATGGFSPRNTSIAGYSPYIQYVVTIFMFLAGVNFLVHFNLLMGNFKKAFSNEELRFYLKVIVLAGLFIMAILIYKTNKPIEEAFRSSFFYVVSIVTCTGFATEDYLLWPTAAWMAIFLLLFAGGCTGSTAGGIKMARHLLVLKNIKSILYKTVHRNGVYPVKLNGYVVSEENNRSIISFVLLYLVVFVVMTFLLILDGLDVPGAASSIATALAGIGPGIGSVGPLGNFAHLHDFSKSVMSLAMFIGRLELLTFFALFTPAFWKY